MSWIILNNRLISSTVSPLMRCNENLLQECLKVPKEQAVEVDIS
jgi:hypothetical protein